MSSKANGNSAREGRVFGVLECRPNQVTVQFSVEEVIEHRHFDCESYDDCLDVVVKKKWSNFTCQQCPIWEHHKRTHGERKAAEESVEETPENG